MILQNNLKSKQQLVKIKEKLSCLIGSEIEILDSTNNKQTFINGLVVDETKSTIILSMDDKTKKIMKSSIIKMRISDDEIDFSDFAYGEKLKDYFNKSVVVKIKKCYD